jgi:hypothetical protein
MVVMAVLEQRVSAWHAAPTRATHPVISPVFSPSRLTGKKPKIRQFPKASRFQTVLQAGRIRFLVRHRPLRQNLKAVAACRVRAGKKGKYDEA